MYKLKLKALLNKYKREFLKMNTIHIKDAIAILVILELNRPLEFEKNKISKVTLNNLFNYLFFSHTPNTNNKPTDIYEVPTLNELEKLKKDIDKELFFAQAIPIGTKEKRAAYVWLTLMIKNGLIKEKEEINTYDFKLIDFINDPELESVLTINLEKNNDNVIVKVL